MAAAQVSWRRRRAARAIDWASSARAIATGCRELASVGVCVEAAHSDGRGESDREGAPLDAKWYNVIAF